MLCTIGKAYDVYFYGLPDGERIRTYKCRHSFQFAMRRRFGAGNWKVSGDYVYVRGGYSGAWLAAAHVTAYSVTEWID